MESDYLASIEKTLETLLSVDRFPEGKLGEMARYAALGSGKRLRSQLVLITAKAYGVAEEISLLPACALELIHTYSLIHDDLPCMDNDDFRRGKPSLHKAFSEWQAVLTGDFLLTYAFEIISQAPHITDGQKNELIHVLAKHAGGKGMLLGQEMDLSFKQQHLNLTDLLHLHRLKTAGLIAAALECGGILGKVKEGEKLAHIGTCLGVAFQIRDDLEDAEDLAQEKPNILNLMTKEEATQLKEDLLKEALQKIDSLSCKGHELKAFSQQLLSRSL